MSVTVEGDFCSLVNKLMVEPRVFFLISSGIYLISSKKDDKFNSLIACSLTQVSANPPRLVVSINKESLTHEYITYSKIFSVSVLSIDTPKKFIMMYGFRSGRTFDKFKEINYKIGKSGAPIIIDNSIAYLDCEVDGTFDCGTHTTFYGKVIDAELLKVDKPMTYSHYIEVLRGKTPTSAPIFIGSC